MMLRYPASEGRRATVSTASSTRCPPVRLPASHRNPSLSRCCSKSCAALMLRFMLPLRVSPRPMVTGGARPCGHTGVLKQAGADSAESAPVVESGGVDQANALVGSACGSGEVAAAGEAFTAMVVDDFFLVFHEQPVELVGEQVDGGIHVDGGGIGMQHASGNGNGSLGLVIGFVETEHGAYVEGLVEVAFQSRQLAVHVVSQRAGDFNLLAVGFDTHRYLLMVTGYGDPIQRLFCANGNAT